MCVSICQEEQHANMAQALNALAKMNQDGRVRSRSPSRPATRASSEPFLHMVVKVPQAQRHLFLEEAVDCTLCLQRSVLL
jgi:hypothetical protein